MKPGLRDLRALGASSASDDERQNPSSASSTRQNLRALRDETFEPFVMVGWLWVSL
jgi:hypothetical protein